MHCDLEPGEPLWHGIVFQAWALVHFVQQKINGGTFNLEQWVEQILGSSYDKKEQAVCQVEVIEIPTGGVSRLSRAGE